MTNDNSQDSIIQSQYLSRNLSHHLRHLEIPSRDHRHSQTRTRIAQTAYRQGSLSRAASQPVVVVAVGLGYEEPSFLRRCRRRLYHLAFHFRDREHWKWEWRRWQEMKSVTRERLLLLRSRGKARLMTREDARVSWIGTWYLEVQEGKSVSESLAHVSE